MSTHPRRRSARRPARTTSAAAGTPRIPRQRTSEDVGDIGDVELPLEVFVDVDDAKLVLHRACEDPAFQEFLEDLPLVRMVSTYLDWIGDGVAPIELAEEAHESVVELERGVGVDLITASGVGRRRMQVLTTACTRLRLVSIVGERLEPGPDVAGWTEEDPVMRAWVRSQVAASVLEASVRWLAADHVLGDSVRHTFATMLITAGEGQPWPLGLASATRPGDLLAEHVDRVVIEHVAELQALGLCAPGTFLTAARGAEPVLRSVAVGLRAAPVPSATV